jgi:hypothetical protein
MLVFLFAYFFANFYVIKAGLGLIIILEIQLLYYFIRILIIKKNTENETQFFLSKKAFLFNKPLTEHCKIIL